MSLKHLILLAAVSSSLLLTACGPSIEKEAPDQVFRKAVQESLKTTGYNYEVEAGISKLEFPQEMQNEENLFASRLSDGIRIDMTGAIDLSSHQVEAIPTIRFEKDNVLASIKLPMLLDLKQLSLTIDPAALNLMGSSFLKEAQIPLNTYQGKSLRATFPAELAANIPLAALFKALPKINDDIYAKIDKKAFSFEKLDKAGEDLGAAYKVRLSTNTQQNNQLAGHLVNALIDVAVAENTKRSGKPGFDAAKLKQAIQSGIQLSAAQTDGKAITDLYLSKEGVLLAQHTIMDMDLAGAKVELFTKARYSNLGKPSFSYQPKPADIIDVEKDALLSKLFSPAALANLIAGMNPGAGTEALTAEEAQQLNEELAKQGIESP